MAKEALAEQINQSLANILLYLPENERYDVEEATLNYCKNIFEASTTENFKGYKLPLPFTAKSAAWQYENWMPKKGDVLVASYPKTGWFLEKFSTNKLFYLFPSFYQLLEGTAITSYSHQM